MKAQDKLLERIYLCHELTPTNSYQPIIGFKCIEYNSYQNANADRSQDYEHLHNLTIYVYKTSSYNQPNQSLASSLS